MRVVSVVFGATENFTSPVPLESDDTIVSHVGLLVADVHEQPLAAITPTVPVPPDSGVDPSPDRRL